MIFNGAMGTSYAFRGQVKDGETYVETFRSLRNGDFLIPGAMDTAAGYKYKGTAGFSGTCAPHTTLLVEGGLIMGFK